jgi:hypothetical protein
MTMSMMNRSLVTLLTAACFCVVWPRTSAAGPITLLVSNCAGPGTIITGSGSLMLDVPCALADTGGAGFGDAAAKGDLTHGLQLGARASGTSSTTAPLSFDGEVRIADTITLAGGTVGTSGFLQLVFAVDGSCNAVHCSEVSFTSGFEEGVFLSANSVGPQGFGPYPVGTATLNVPFTFGVPSSLNLLLLTDVSFNTLGGATGSAGLSGSEDFFNTATLTSFAVLDGNMQPVAGGSVVSADGLFQAQAVPEPASLVLLGTGIAMAVSRRKRV